ncbi:hypothetical protein TWF694_008342 [Orbilia ellipsospora]|uniref:Glycine zipper domain-containing protein n=1 Tax=Orbilia ellipsospora TaxID=2528407 RepID=A0AAV9XG83_9PEZI
MDLLAGGAGAGVVAGAIGGMVSGLLTGGGTISTVVVGAASALLGATLGTILDQFTPDFGLLGPAVTIRTLTAALPAAQWHDNPRKINQGKRIVTTGDMAAVYTAVMTNQNINSMVQIENARRRAIDRRGLNGLFATPIIVTTGGKDPFKLHLNRYHRPYILNPQSPTLANWRRMTRVHQFSVVPDNSRLAHGRAWLALSGYNSALRKARAAFWPTQYP